MVEQVDNQEAAEEEYEDELSSDEQEADYSKMPTSEHASVREFNLFKDITEDISEEVMEQK